MTECIFSFAIRLKILKQTKDVLHICERNFFLVLKNCRSIKLRSIFTEQHKGEKNTTIFTLFIYFHLFAIKNTNFLIACCFTLSLYFVAFNLHASRIIPLNLKSNVNDSTRDCSATNFKVNSIPVAMVFLLLLLSCVICHATQER